MAKFLERINLLVSIITGVPIILGYTAWVTGWFRNLPSDIHLLLITVLLLILLFLNAYMLWGVNRILNPYKPPLIKSRNEPETYIYIHGQWRYVPDWETRDYLAHLLGFRPGEEDISIKTKDEIDKLQKGKPLESIKTYARR